MTEKVWVSDSFRNTSISSKLTTNPDGEWKDCPSEFDRMDKIMRKYERGITISDEERPRRAHPYYRARRIRKLPDFFKVNVFFVVSAAFAEVLGKFDLGDGGLFPIDLYQGNRTELILGEWYFLNFGCQKEAFLPDQSTGSFKHPERWPEDRCMIGLPVDNQIAVSARALDGGDLWIDPRLDSAFFMSGRLETALKTAKLTRTVHRAQCTVVEV